MTANVVGNSDQLILSSYHCCAEWHLAILSPSCRLVYPFAFRISKTSGRFSCSATNVARFFRCDERTIRRAYKELEKLGFFVLIERGLFEPHVYKVLSHKEWSQEHPSECTQKEVFPWTGEGDKLGQALWAASGCKMRFKDYQMIFIRSLGVPEDQILAEFTEFWSTHTHYPKFKRHRRLLAGHFVMHLKDKLTDRAAAQV
jgi:hypothetical protein